MQRNIKNKKQKNQTSVAISRQATATVECRYRYRYLVERVPLPLPYLVERVPLSCCDVMWAALKTFVNIISTIMSCNKRSKTDPEKAPVADEELFTKIPPCPITVSRHHFFNRITGEIEPSTPITPIAEMKADTSRTQRLIQARGAALARMPDMGDES